VHDLSTDAEYRFVPEGPLVTAAERATCAEVIAAEHADWLVLSGSLPRGVPPDAYAELIRMAAARGIKVVLDTSGPPLAAALGAGLALIKPSLRELEALLGRKLPDAAAQDEAVQALLAQGAAERIALSLGADGALLASRSRLLRRPAIPVQPRGAVGAGDSFCAALTLALARGESDDVALNWGLAAGAASVMNTGTAHPRRAAIESLLSRGDREGTA
jgi:6-phosphofructokinase 2